MKYLPVVIGFAVLLEGCATQDYWTKPGFNTAAFQQDGAYCQMVAAGTPQMQTPQVPASYVANTTVNGDTAQTSIRPQANGRQAIAAIGAASINADAQQRTQRLCMASRGYTMTQSPTCSRLTPNGACLF